MEKNNLIKILIPIVALVVVFESIMLVSSLDNGGVKNDDLIKEIDSEQEAQQEETSEPVADFVWEMDTNEMKVGQSYKIVLNLLSKTDLMIDAVESHIYYDSKKVTVSKLDTNKDLGKLLKPSGIDNDKGFVTAILWKDDEIDSSYKTKSGDTVMVLSFMVTPKVEGEIDFDLSTSMTDTKLATIILEGETNRSLPYLTNKLKINAMK